MPSGTISRYDQGPPPRATDLPALVNTLCSMAAPLNHHPILPAAQKPSLPVRIASATTRLIAIAIVTGGLLTAALNLWEPGRHFSPDTAPTETHPGARLDESVFVGLPIVQQSIRGDEAAARDAVVATCRAMLGESLAADQSTAPTANPSPDALHTESWPELARDDDGRWAVHQLPDVPRRIVGVSRRGGDSLICCWGGYDQTAPDEWTIWTMRLPQPEK